MFEVETPHHDPLRRNDQGRTLRDRPAAAQAGVKITNGSDKENLVMLKHFGPGNPDAAALIVN